MVHANFEDDVAQWDLTNGGGLCSDLEVWLERYVDIVSSAGRSKKTIKTYREAISTFIDFSRQYDSILDIDSITAKYVNNYVMWYQNILASKSKITPLEQAELRGNVPGKMGHNDAKISIIKQFESSVSNRITILKQFLKFVTANNKQLHDFTKAYEWYVKVEIKVQNKDYLTEEETEELVAFMKAWPDIFRDYSKRKSVEDAYRDAFIVLVYCLTGARSDEILSVKLEDIYEAHQKDDSGKKESFYMIRLLQTKGDKYREIALFKDDVERFVLFFKESLPDPSYFISSPFVNGFYINRKIADSTMYRFATWAMKIQGIDKSGRHVMRRGYATNELAKGKDIGSVAKELGHTSITTTDKHYVKNNPELLMKQKLRYK